MHHGLLSEAPLPAAGEAPLVALPFRLHADAVEELLERLPPLVVPPRWDARHVRAVEPGALLTLTLLAASHGVLPPALPVPADALIPPLRVRHARGAATPFDAVGGAAVSERLAGWGWSPPDARRLAAFVTELARNAIEHGEAPVWIAAWRTAPAELRVAVADGGPGFGGSLRLPDEAHAVVAGAPPWSDVRVRDQLPVLAGVQVEAVIPSPPGPSRLSAAPLA